MPSLFAGLDILAPDPPRMGHGLEPAVNSATPAMRVRSWGRDCTIIRIGFHLQMRVPVRLMPIDLALVDRLDALLPQTQCGQCGYGGCMPYAEAMARGDAAPNRCPPGGDTVIAALATALGQSPLPSDPACGAHKPRTLAHIREAECIGCTKCIQACPVDAIVGAAKRMHSVVAAWCTGCELCVAPCPVDCIELLPHALPRMTQEESDTARQRHQAHRVRLQRRQNNQATAAVAPENTAAQLLAAALARAKAHPPSI